MPKVSFVFSTAGFVGFCDGFTLSASSVRSNCPPSPPPPSLSLSLSVLLSVCPFLVVVMMGNVSSSLCAPKLIYLGLQKRPTTTAATTTHTATTTNATTTTRGRLNHTRHKNETKRNEIHSSGSERESRATSEGPGLHVQLCPGLARTWPGSLSLSLSLSVWLTVPRSAGDRQ